ncbi:hypothetical protein H8705_11690 [Oscillospiraceae bacterium NSJ-64]|uniref:Uncharacterized protein n=2 Tax=Youxingia wuxianensis TaxID=2763678 RepID=A0A926IJ18_9FIRM|nr:hypothetical protein [Youxingia wuxianensis]
MYIWIGALLVLIGGILIWFHIPYSPVKRDFKNDVAVLKDSNQLVENDKLFKCEDFSHLPLAIQRYIESSGYIGMPKMNYMKMEYHNVDFMQGKNGPALKIDYTQYNFVAAPCRMALIDSSMFGVPFEGYDYYQNGIGGMKGVIAKGITLFDQKGADMDKACLATFLAESMFAPSILLQDYITFEEISDYKVKATITFAGQTASGIFTFNEQYEMISFTTNDRAVTNGDGTMEYIPWSAVCGEYQFSETGMKYPTKFQAVWHYPDGDFIYFDGKISSVIYGNI